MEFERYPKIPRLSKGWSVSEKIDGTNALVAIVLLSEVEENQPIIQATMQNPSDNPWVLVCGSRNRFLTRAQDNFGFCQWVHDNADDLFRLGPGRHHGEWFGWGIQKNPLQLPFDERRLAMFNPKWADQGPTCVEVVPQLGVAKNGFDLDDYFNWLRTDGTYVKGVGEFAKAEGIIAYHLGSGQLYKRTFDDDGGKHAG